MQWHRVPIKLIAVAGVFKVYKLCKCTFVNYKFHELSLLATRINGNSNPRKKHQELQIK